MNTPAVIEPIYRTDHCNDVVSLYNGLAKVVPFSGLGLQGEGEAKVFVEWLPQAKVLAKVQASGIAGSHAISVRSEPKYRVEITRFGKPYSSAGQLWASTFTAAEQTLTFRLGDLEIGENGALSSLVFHIPNFPSYIGSPVRLGTRQFNGRVSLTGGHWTIALDPHDKTDTLLGELKEEGGYALTHTALLNRSDGNPFPAAEAAKILEYLHFFLSFARGQWTGPILPVSKLSNGDQWEQWFAPIINPWERGTSGPFSWLPYAAEGSAMEKLWPGFFALLDDPIWYEPLKIAITWYLEAQASGLVETRIVLSQAALEMLSWVAIVEKDAVEQPADFDGLKAHERLRRYLNHIGIPTIIPIELAALATHAASKSQDGPGALTSVRNGMTHWKSQRSARIAFEVRSDAARLALWYVQLSILRLGGYHGVYHSRVSPLSRPTTPWVP